MFAGQLSTNGQLRIDTRFLIKPRGQSDVTDHQSLHNDFVRPHNQQLRDQEPEGPRSF
jgi:hypothetical protein